MTGPMPSFWEPYKGVDSPIAQSEWQNFLSQREAYLGSIRNELSQQRTGQPSYSALAQLAQQGQQQQDTQTQGVDQLIHQAGFWGIPPEAASQMPREELQKLVDQMRHENRPNEPLAPGFDLAAEFFLGTEQGMMSGLKHLPIAGAIIARQKWFQDADQWLNYTEEAVRATTPESTQLLYSGAKLAGEVAGMWLPAEGAWKLAGAAGRIVPAKGLLGTPILRMAAQGAATGAILEGGSEHPYWAMAAGGGLGAFTSVGVAAYQRFGPAIAAATRKVSGAFSFPEGIVQRIAELPGIHPVDFSQALEHSIPQEVGEIPVNVDRNVLEQLHAVMNDQNMSPEAQASARAMYEQIAPRSTQVAVQRDVTGMEIPTEINPIPADMGTDVGLMQFAREALKADAAAAQMSKQAMAVQSSSLPDLASITSPNEVSVAVASHIDNPGGINVVPGIPDPAGFAAGMEKIPNWRFAQREGRLDALVSDEPITNEMVEQYEKHGMFSGQVGYTLDGTSVRILDVTEAGARIKPLYGKTESFVPLESVMPSPISTGVREDPGLWQSFQRFQNEQFMNAAKELGAPLTPDQGAILRTQNLQPWMENFLDQAGIRAPGERARAMQYFNERFVDSFKAYAPVESAMQDAAAQAASAAALANPATPVTRLRNIAATKGYSVIPDGIGGWRVTDEVPGGGGAPVQLSFGTQEAAESWLSKIHRPVPDITPAGIVPPEVANGIPRATPGAPSLRGDKLFESTAQSVEDIADAAAAEGDDALAERIRAQVAQARASGKVRELRQAWDYGLANFQPMRNRMLAMDRKLVQHGLELKPFDDWDAMSTGLDKNHNWANPHLDRWTRITDVFNADDLNSGKVVETWLIQDPGARLLAAQRAKFTAEQIGMLDEMDRFFPEVINDLNRFAGRTSSHGLSTTGEIKNLLTSIRVKQFADVDPFKTGPLSDGTKPFVEQLQRAHVDLREFDARSLGNYFVRAHGFKEFLEPSMVATEQKWKNIAKIEDLGPMADVMLNWIKLVRDGYSPGTDVVLESLHSAANFFIPGITRSQVRSIFNGGLSLTHHALLGFRPDVMARDSIQLFLALPRAGTDLISVMAKYATDATSREDIWDRGIRNGWAQLGKPRIAQPGVFEDPLLFSEESQSLVQQPPPSRRYEAVQAVGDWLHDITPESLKHLSGSKLSPLHFYTKQQERMRLFVGEAGYQRASRAITAFKEQGAAGDMDTLLAESGADSYEPAVTRRFKDLLASNPEEAAAFMGRQLADATQFRYGSANTPEVARTLFGKMGMQLGSFSTQFYQYTKESIRYGGLAGNAKFWGMMGTVWGGLKLAEAETGWNFGKWQFYNSLVFSGGPWFQVAADALGGVGALAQASSRPSDQPGGQAIIDQGNRGIQAAGTALNYLNPVAGAYRTASSLISAQDAPNPSSFLMETLLTGERGPGRDWRNQNLQYQQQQPPLEMMQQGSTPVRGSSFSMPVTPIPGPLRAPENSPINPGQPPVQYNQALPDSMVTANQDRLRYMESLLSGQVDYGLDDEDRSFLNSIRPLEPMTRADSWEMYQMHKQQRGMPQQPQATGGRGGGGFF